jgi:hypothetical protein
MGLHNGFDGWLPSCGIKRDKGGRRMDAGRERGLGVALAGKWYGDEFRCAPGKRRKQGRRTIGERQVLSPSPVVCNMPLEFVNLVYS